MLGARWVGQEEHTERNDDRERTSRIHVGICITFGICERERIGRDCQRACDE